MRIPSFNEIMSVSQTRGLLSEAPHLWDGLVGWWPLNEGGGDTAFDASGWGNNGTWNGAGDHHTVGEKGRCGQFNGLDDTVQFTDPELGAESFTISAWINRFETGDRHEIVQGKDGGSADMSFFVTDTDILRLFTRELNDDTLVSGNTYTIPKNVWVHVVGIRNGNSLYVYANGNLDNSVSGTIRNITSRTGWYIGCNSGDTMFIDGQISDVSIHNRALLPSEIQQLYVDPWVMGRRRPTLVSFSITTPTPIIINNPLINNPFLINRSPLFYPKTIKSFIK